MYTKGKWSPIGSLRSPSVRVSWAEVDSALYSLGFFSFSMDQFCFKKLVEHECSWKHSENNVSGLSVCFYLNTCPKLFVLHERHRPIEKYCPTFVPLNFTKLQFSHVIVFILWPTTHNYFPLSGSGSPHRRYLDSSNLTVGQLVAVLQEQ